MTNTLIAPENENFPQRKRWTRAECEELMRNGQLVGRYELIDGEILSKMGQNPPHALTITLLAQWLMPLFGIIFVQIQLPITIPGAEGNTNEPEPDVAVTNVPLTTFTHRHPGPADLLLVVEVSDTTRTFDLTTKALLYARVGIREYWVMDIAQRCIHIHRSPTPEGYAVVTRHDADAAVSLADRPESAIRAADLFPPLE